MRNTNKIVNEMRTTIFLFIDCETSMAFVGSEMTGTTLGFLKRMRDKDRKMTWSVIWSHQELIQVVARRTC